MKDAVAEVERRKEQWRRFLDGSGRRCMLLVQYKPDDELRPLPSPEAEPQRIEWAWRQYEKQLARCQWLEDDFLPRLMPYTGTEIFANALGCSVYQPADDMPSARPLIHSAREVAKVRVPGLDAPPLQRCFDIADELRRRAGVAALMQLPDYQSPMDTAALVWDKSDFYMGVIDAPEAVHELSAKARELFVAFADAWFERYGREYIAHYPDYFMSGGITLSEDEVGAVGCDTFAEFFLPELLQLSQRYGGLGMHCCADSRHHWPAFSQLADLRVLNLVRPVRQLREAYLRFENGPVQMHDTDMTPELLDWIARETPGARVILRMPASSAEEARKVVESVRRFEERLSA